MMEQAENLFHIDGLKMRNVKILQSQLKDLSVKDLFFLLKKTLFFDEPILVYEKAVGLVNIQPLKEIDCIEIKKGNIVDLEIARQTLKPLPWEFQCHIFDGVKDFFIARDEFGVQHISWVYFQRHRNRFLALGEKEAEIKFCLTLPAMRGRGIYPRVLTLISEYLHLQGIERVFMCVHRDNNPSIKGVEKAGFRQVGEIRLIKMMGFQISPRLETNRRGE